MQKNGNEIRKYCENPLPFVGIPVILQRQIHIFLFQTFEVRIEVQKPLVSNVEDNEVR